MTAAIRLPHAPAPLSSRATASMPASTVPWRVGDLSVMAGANLIGLIGLLVAWFGGSGTVDVGSQLAWLRLGIAAVVVAGVGNAQWILAGMRAIGQRRREVLTRAPRAALRPAVAVVGSQAGSADELVSGPQMTRYHRPECPAATGRRVEAAPLESHLDESRRPCGICRPTGWGEGNPDG